MTDPKNPNSSIAPSDGSGLSFMSLALTKVIEVDLAYQVAILWQAASSMGVPCVWYRGPKIDRIAENRAGYPSRVNITSERYRSLVQAESTKLLMHT